MLSTLLTHAETRDDVTHVYVCGLIMLHELHYYFFLICHLQQLYMYCARTRLIADETLSSAAGDQDSKTVLALV